MLTRTYPEADSPTLRAQPSVNNYVGSTTIAWRQTQIEYNRIVGAHPPLLLFKFYRSGISSRRCVLCLIVVNERAQCSELGHTPSMKPHTISLLSRSIPVLRVCRALWRSGVCHTGDAIMYRVRSNGLVLLAFGRKVGGRAEVACFPGRPQCFREKRRTSVYF